MIHVENLTKCYNALCAVDHINLEIQNGEILGLLGPNGAGKTTTLRMLTGYLTPTSGTVRVKDFSLDAHLLDIKKLMGYLPESAPLYHNMLVYDYLDYVARIRGLHKNSKTKAIQRLVDLCGLEHIMHRSIGELSKGLKQRVGLAHAMMNDPEILVLDEPTSGLDPNQIIEIREIIRRIGREKTVILSTHILSEVEATCDRVVIIDRGRIVADDRTENLKHNTGQEYFIHLTLLNADFQAIHERLNRTDGLMKIESIGESQQKAQEIRLTCQGSVDPRKDIYLAIKQTDWILVEFRRETQNLETIFHQLTKED
jgi:ABC-2 type transport system ATP-binding protein